MVTDSIYIPPGSRITGEIWSTILAKGNNFGNVNNPRPVFLVGKPNDVGVAEISELILSTSGPVPGAIMMQINMKQRQQGDVGLWDVHFRIGGSKGTDLQYGNCPQGGTYKPECMGAHTMLHIAQTGSAYLENVLAWVADHDLDQDPNKVSIYNGRGILVESKEGPVWMYGTSSEHSVLYQYNFANTNNIMVGMIQTETPYFQVHTFAFTVSSIKFKRTTPAFQTYFCYATPPPGENILKNILWKISFRDMLNNLGSFDRKFHLSHIKLK